MWSLLTLPFIAVSAVRAGNTVDVDVNASVTSGSTVDMVAAAWYAGWHSDDFPLKNVSWDKYTHLTYAFAETAPDVKTLSLNQSNSDLLPEFVATAKKNGVKALVSIGGWTGSLYFSSNVATAENRTAFVKTVSDFATQYELDGIDFDWEYPNADGIGCNTVSPNDTANFLAFLQELRQDPVGSNLILTAATAITPFKGPNGTAITDASEFAKVLDYVAIMNYDVSGSWLDYVGSNAPLNDTCTDASHRQGSAVSAVKAWTDANIPAHQLVLGVPAYGHSFSVNASDAFGTSDNKILQPFPAFDKEKQPEGDAWGKDQIGEKDPCGTVITGGTYYFWGLIDNGFLNANGTAAPGIEYSFDECSQTPYVYNETSNILVAFDDATSFAAKGDFIAKNNLRGFALWEAGGDRDDILLDSIRQAAGFQDEEQDC